MREVDKKLRNLSHGQNTRQNEFTNTNTNTELEITPVKAHSTEARPRASVELEFVLQWIDS